jgi:outer membrane protein assembly factor BamE
LRAARKTREGAAFTMMLSRSVVPIVFFLAGCQQVPMLPTLMPYQMDIQQGNVITQEMLSKLKPGMTPSQVRFILGTPLVVDAFHKDRWDYVYRYTKGGTVQEHRRVVVVFQDGKLARIEGDVIPAQRAGTTEGGVKIDKPEPAQPASAKPAPPKTKAEFTTAPQPEGSRLTTTTGDHVTSGGASPDAMGSGTKPKEERGFFGRMLERLGF